MSNERIREYMRASLIEVITKEKLSTTTDLVGGLKKVNIYFD